MLVLEAILTYIRGNEILHIYGYRCKRLREEAMNEELINAKKDTTRP